MGRKIRVGVLASRQTIQTQIPESWNVAHGATIGGQLLSAQHFDGSEFQLTALTEPGNEEDGELERGMRHRRIHHGILDATNADELKLLDVIAVNQMCVAVTERVLDAITEAVESGVGLLHAGHLGTVYPGTQHPSVCRLMLTDAVSVYHTPHQHNLPRGATVLEGHVVLPGVQAGRSLMLPGCGPVYRPKAGTRTLMMKDEPVNPQAPPDARLNGMRQPVLVVGRIGRGRVMVTGIPPLTYRELPELQGTFAHHVLNWLAEERVAERQLWESARKK
jgi:hypothetical protein